VSCSLTLQQTPALKAVPTNSMKILQAMFAQVAMLLVLLAVGVAQLSAFLALFPVTINHLQELVFQLVTQSSMPLEEAHLNVLVVIQLA